jgi:predicted kinase
MEQQTNLIAKLKSHLPNNLIIVGPKYSGKKTLVSELFPDFYFVDGKVENIRNLSQGDYVFADIDDWSQASYSAMLKLLEENEDHIIITCKNIMNLPRSIQSRCIIEHMENYKDIADYCDSIGQHLLFTKEMLIDIDKFIYKEEYDFDVYFSVLCNRLLDRIKNGEDLYREYLISSKYNSQKNLKSLNKKQFVVNWQFDLKGLSNEWERL